MQGFELNDLLRTIRALEDANDAIPVLNDDDAIKVMAAWKKTDQSWAKPRGKMPTVTSTNHAAVWRWIVSGWKIDERSVSRACGLTERVVHEKLNMLIALRLIYPDGSTSKAAKTAEQVYVARALGIKAKQRKQEKDPAAAKKPGDDDASN